MTIVVTRVTNLPAGFDALAGEATAEGVRNMAMLAEGFRSGSARFDLRGEALFMASVEGVLAGVGGVSQEAQVGTMRLRRFYVRPAFRRLGVARRLAEAAIAHAEAGASVLTVNARASAAAAPFWEAMGFRPVAHPSWTHQRP